MKGLGIENKITLKHIVLGYKIDDKNYLALNFLITVVRFSIYKSYFISEQKAKYIDVYRIFENEYIQPKYNFYSVPFGNIYLFCIYCITFYFH
jgi:hypothetical protein